jgi:hypothetical protein
MRRSEVTSAMVKLMAPETRVELGFDCPQLPSLPSAGPGATVLERQMQRTVANYCLLHCLPFVWHATNKRSTATRGCPDFIIGLSRGTLWLEMKLPGEKLSTDQEAFQQRLKAQGIRLEICYSDAEAIALIGRKIPVTPKGKRVTGN